MLGTITGSCQQSKARSELEEGAHSLKEWREAENVLNKQSLIADMGGPPTCGFDGGLTTACSENFTFYEMADMSRP
jgi:hypothetical protein